MKPNSLRTRLLLTLLGVMVLAVAVVFLFAQRGTANEFNRFLARSIEREQQLIAALLEERLQNNDIAGVQALVETLDRIYGRSVALLNADNIIIASSRRAEIGRRLPNDTPHRPRNPFYFRLDDNRQKVRFTPQEIPPGAFRPPLRSMAGSTLPTGSNEQSFMGSINRFLWLTALAAIILAGVVALGLSRRILGPVEALTAAAQQMAHGDLSQRVAVTTQDEIGALSQAFNLMASGLQKQEQLRRNLVSDVAHELRTPLSNIRGYLEAVQDGFVAASSSVIDSLHEETLLLSRLIEDLQELSLAEAQQLTLELQACRVGGLITQAVQSFQPAAIEKQITLLAHLPPALPDGWADPRRLAQVLRNLLQNAITYTEAGGTVTVTAVAHPSEIEISISDTGAGIEPDHLPFIFDRFYRTDQSRARATGGTGLGLAITKALVDMQNGRIEASSIVGQGTTFTVTLPRK